MFYITIAVNAPANKAQGVKEDLAMHLEKFGDARVISITKENGAKCENRTYRC